MYIIMYHYVRRLKYSRFPEIKALDLKFFQQQIQYLKENFQIVTMEQVLESVTENYELPEDAVLLTFDDGYCDHYSNVFPILQKEGIQGSFFIPGKTFIEHKLLDVNKIHFILASAKIRDIIKDLCEELDYYRGKEYDFPSNRELYRIYAKDERFDNKEVIFVKRILQTALPVMLRNIISSKLFQKYLGLSEEKFAYELYLTYEQIRYMKSSGMFIGIHGYDHKWLGELSEQEMQKDIDKSLEAMSDFIEVDRWVMNYPYGSYNQEMIEYIKGKGCELGLTTDVRIADLLSDNKYCLPRLDTNDFPPKSENYRNIKRYEVCI